LAFQVKQTVRQVNQKSVDCLSEKFCREKLSVNNG
jgi:hypothetical protein